ncbi:hypothetical protein [Streptomyces griseocarneus]|uniref:hypothetical protein n=1 Tax=Streptomyces griseocarneus TaxID=51201 RepID=UPI00167C4FB3|nr:hypothetical protein [Streptomyces griseocarneus]MBZ6476734.1 hypothetical protein [Streptomyces griseocarneus]GHG80612.1 hypothetical protein GCM10018779_62330 [Streptomyces griseocarneus]
MSKRISGQDEGRIMWVQTLDGRQAWPDDGLSEEVRAFAVDLLKSAENGDAAVEDDQPALLAEST